MATSNKIRHNELYDVIPATERILSVLMENLLGKGDIIFTDNFYASPTLATHFHENQTYLCGTIWSKRKHHSKKFWMFSLRNLNQLSSKTVHIYKSMIACKVRAVKDKAGNQQKIVYMLSLVISQIYRLSRKKLMMVRPVILNYLFIVTCVHHENIS